MSKIIRNVIRCLNCGDTIESKHHHDFVACSCFVNEVDNRGVAVDGGLVYLRRIGNPGCWEDLSEFEEVEE